MSNIQLAQTDPEIAKCFDVMVQLRPHLEREHFVERIRRQMETGFQMAYLYDHDRVRCVAGFRIQLNLAWGRHLYVDDLITAEDQRSHGYGEQMLNWLSETARSNQCRQLHLDSGVHRPDAHRFYHRQGLTINSFHFGMKV